LLGTQAKRPLTHRMQTLSRIAALLLLPLVSCGQAPPQDIQVHSDLSYAVTKEARQTLNIYQPKTPSKDPRPLIVFIHGGGWEAGNKNNPGFLYQLLNDGRYVGASVGYRLTDTAAWPAQIHDCKAAIRWLRGHADKYGIDPKRIAVFGISAGGHLVSMLGTSGDIPELEGKIGEHLDQSSRVSAVVNFCGPANFNTFAGKGSNIDPNSPNNAIGKLLGGPLSEKTDIAKAASPITYISKDDPPFLHIHGTADNLVPYAQVQEFDKALESAQIPSTILTGQGGPHVFGSAQLIRQIRTFLGHHLLGHTGQVKEGPVDIR
jgi:acetyl esterase/lipase